MDIQLLRIFTIIFATTTVANIPLNKTVEDMEKNDAITTATALGMLLYIIVRVVSFSGVLIGVFTI